MKKKYQTMETTVYSVESRPIICTSGVLDDENTSDGTW